MALETHDEPTVATAFSIAPRCVTMLPMRETIVETSRMSLYYHPLERIVHHELHSYPGFELLQEILLKGLEVMKAHGATNWLSDDRNGGALPRSHHEWGDRVWAPQAVKAGWKNWGLVLPNDLLHTANMQKLAQLYAAQGVTVETFSNPDDAFRWLRHRGSQLTA